MVFVSAAAALSWLLVSRVRRWGATWLGGTTGLGPALFDEGVSGEFKVGDCSEVNVGELAGKDCVLDRLPSAALEGK